MLRRILVGQPDLLAQVDHAEVISAWFPGSLSAHGVLDGLEYAWYTDEPPTELPSPELITLT